MFSKPITSHDVQERIEESEITTKLSLERHTGWVNHIICFEKPIFKIVSSSKDLTIRIWDSRSGKCVRSIKPHKKNIRKLIKWNEREFLSCSADGSVQMFSVTDFSVHKKIFQYKSGVFSITRLTNDIFVSVTQSNDLFFTSISKKRTVKRYREKTSFRTTVLLSKDKSKNRFYVNTSDQKNTIKVMSFEKDLSTLLTEKTYDRHEGEINTMTSFIVQNEFLVCGSQNNMIYMYNSSVDENDINFLRRIQMTSPITFIEACVNRYICLGDKSGSFHIFDSRNGLQNLVEIEVHEKSISCICLMDHETGQPLTLLSSSKDRTIKAFTIHDIIIESFDKIRYEQTRERFVDPNAKKTTLKIEIEEEEEEQHDRSDSENIDEESNEEERSPKVKRRRKKKRKGEITYTTPPRKQSTDVAGIYSIMNEEEMKHEIYRVMGGDPVKDASKFLESSMRRVSPNKTVWRRKKKKKKKLEMEMDEDDPDVFTLIHDESEDEKRREKEEEGKQSLEYNEDEDTDEEERRKKQEKVKFVVPRVTKISFFNPPEEKRFGF